jgi:hypothetical protein
VQVHCIKDWRLVNMNQLQDEIKLSKAMTEQPEFGIDFVKQELAETKLRVAEQLREDKIKIREFRENVG